MCGKGVKLGPFPSDSLGFRSYDFDEIVHIMVQMAHIRPLYGEERLQKSSFKS